MHPEKFVPQVNFCRWFLQRHCVDEPVFPWRILFTYEAKPTREDVINFHNSHFWDDENPHATCPHDFQQHYGSTWGMGFWMDVLLSHNIFHLISPMMHAWNSLNTYCMGSWKMCYCMCIKTNDFSTMVHHLILMCSLRPSGPKILANMDRSWWPNCLACTFTCIC